MLGALSFSSLNISTLSPSRIRSLPLYLARNRIDILCIQETHLTPANLQLLPFTLPFMTLYSNPGTQSARGVATLIRTSALDSRSVTIPTSFESGRVLCTRVSSRSFQATLCNIYAPNSPLDRSGFFLHLLDFLSNQPAPYILLGDWNCVLLTTDRLNGSGRGGMPDLGTRSLANLVRELELVDSHRQLDDDPACFTFSYPGGQSRLDRIYNSSNLVPLKSAIETINSLGSDHLRSPILRIRHPDFIQRGKRPWRLRLDTLEEPNLGQALEISAS